MTDIVSPQKRSSMMAGIKGKDTRPERAIRSALHRLGFRFRVHDKRFPGKPDLVLPKYGTVMFVHGCFWHRHEGCRYTTMPATRQNFWVQKFKANVDRDRRHIERLLADNWRVFVIWECAIEHDFETTVITLVDYLSECGATFVEIPPSPVVSSF